MFSRQAIPLIGNTGWSIFYASPNYANFNENLQTWVKPRGINFVYFFLIGAGGGGGKPDNGTLSVAAGGGASGSIAAFLVPEFVLPDILYIRVGVGGLGATTSGNGDFGGDTEIFSDPEIFTLISLGGSGNGSGGASNLGGTMSSFVNVNGYQMGISIRPESPYYTVGQAGSNGAASANLSGTSSLWGGNGLIVCGGAGGGNGTGSGGSITTSNVDIPSILGGAGSTGGNGYNGFGYGQPIKYTNNTSNPLPLLTFTGGAGGGGHTTGQAGRGGNGGYGCGGGGGGSCTNAAGLAGNGGNGGDGLVIIGAF